MEASVSTYWSVLVRSYKHYALPDISENYRLLNIFYISILIRRSKEQNQKERDKTSFLKKIFVKYFRLYTCIILFVDYHKHVHCQTKLQLCHLAWKSARSLWKNSRVEFMNKKIKGINRTRETNIVRKTRSVGELDSKLKRYGHFDVNIYS